MKKIPVLILLFVFCFGLTTIYSQTTQPAETTPQIKESSAIAPESEAAGDFQSDGCTMWFDGEYKSCCESHDQAYFKNGGSWQARLQADNRLFVCVSKKGVGYAITAPIMWLGVRIFGSPWFPIHKKRKKRLLKNK